MTLQRNPSLVTRRTVLRIASAALMLGVMPSLAFSSSYDDFFKAAKLDDVRTMESLLKRGFDPNTIEPERGDTGLILALREKSMGVVTALLDSPRINLEARTGNGDNALMIAAFTANKPAVELLLGKGALVNRSGWTPLHYAAASGEPSIAQMLLDRSAVVDALSPNKTTPVMMAARSGNIMMVKVLLDAGADASLKNDQGMTAIDFAREANAKDIVDGLTFRLKRAGKL
ncbi:MAG: ankyrin repeat domain-containing protein [Oxalicibacterium faecigallinarum]|uniref:ankyrin repeat domain-containing protein n=1 Tax=Oxalicibacterium faecigallinarum TaxID=573741 RepID=UPI002809A94C|nr:ankyrin repeat domain-containing protein [Oxalicibacterium faecigallinarum]MDQ7968641.1 ankyrin repeat domain-containing protein [Oxalicibacterium faecigallinarum]